MNNVPHLEFHSLTLGVYSTSEIKKLSQIEITNPEAFDHLEHPTKGGLHDRRLEGTQNEPCETCGLGSYARGANACPGHFGHIMFPLPVFNPVFLKTLYQLLRGTCLACHTLVASAVSKTLTLYQLQALDYGLIGVAQELAEVVNDPTYSTAASDSAKAELLEEKFVEIVQEALVGKDQEELKKSASVKTVVELRQQVFKEFTKVCFMSLKKKCPHCSARKAKMTLTNDNRIVFPEADGAATTLPSEEGDDDDVQEVRAASNDTFTPLNAKKHLRFLWQKQQLFLEHLFRILRLPGCSNSPNVNLSSNGSDCPLDIFFFDAILVPPPRFRPLSVVSGRKYLHTQSAQFKEIIQDVHGLRNVLRLIKGEALTQAQQNTVDGLRGKNSSEKVHFMWHQLQNHVSGVYDGSMDKLSKSKGQIILGTKQRLEKKEGLFRKHMMGKRVNFACRSVISPDNSIMIDEIGVPLVFAKKLTYPEAVTDFNVEKLRMAVLNGPNVYPGAEKVQLENGSIILLNKDDEIMRHGQACRLQTTPTNVPEFMRSIPKIVHRHMVDGDMLLLNRQPSLHKPSIMAHRARVLPGEKTLRLHYANCKSYNADFDGDEMNAHYPQNEVARSEAINIASVNHQYLVPRDGSPLSSLIQDHIIGGTLLTMRGQFFTKEEYQQLVFNAIPFTTKMIKTVPPCMLKPKILWSGKQVVTTVIMNVLPPGVKLPNVEGKAKTSIKNWQKEPPRVWKAGGPPLNGVDMSESEIVIRWGDLMVGVIDKGSVGPTAYGLIHCCYEIYGGHVSTALLSAFSRLFAHYLKSHRGFTLGIEDFLLTIRADKRRRKIMHRAKKVGNAVLADAFSGDVEDADDTEELRKLYRKAHLSREDTGLKSLDRSMKDKTDNAINDINSVCMPNGLLKGFPENNLQLMVQSGAKGATVNAMQISCLLGQVELEGRRVPLMLNGSSLPSFLPYDSAPRAGGFIDGRFLTGIRPQEFFFHCMAGREGLIDTAVKTSRSGYLQRCLVKHLEGISVNYDLTVRDSDGSVVQFLYGEDGLDVCKMQMLKEDGLSLLVNNYDAVMHSVDDNLLQYDADLMHHKENYIKWINRNRTNSVNSNRISPFLKYVAKCPQPMSTNAPENLKNFNEHVLSWYELDERKKRKFSKKAKKCPDPVNSAFRPDLTFASVSENFDYMIEQYVSRHPDKFLKEEQDEDAPAVNSTRKLSANDFRKMNHYRAFTALAQPGEAVGMLAAQSIGEPSTQMTLNTFHFAGRGEMNITLGIPRLREILMVASANIATPMMDLPLRDIPDVEEKAEQVKIKLCSVSLSEVVTSVEITDTLYVQDARDCCRKYTIRMHFLPHKLYRGKYNVTPLGIMDFIEQTFFRQITAAMKKKWAMKEKARTFRVYRARRVDVVPTDTIDVEGGGDDDAPPANENAAEEDGAESSADEGNDGGDTLSSRSQSRHNQDVEYDDPEPEEDVVEPDEVYEGDDVEKITEGSNEIEEIVEESIEQNFSNTWQKKGKIGEDERLRRIAKVLQYHKNVSHYDFDGKKLQWCEFTLQCPIQRSQLDMRTILESEIKSAQVYRVPKVKKAFVMNNPNSSDGEKMIRTQGVNFLEIFGGIDYADVIDINKIYSNDIHHVAAHLGIEAARAVIVKEIQNVVATYGIQVNPRHLLLISDYMTIDGKYKPFNRAGIASNASPLQQMTFETTMNFLQNATLSATTDQLKSPSARLIVGRHVGLGTGCFDQFMKPECEIKKMIKERDMKVASFTNGAKFDVSNIS